MYGLSMALEFFMTQNLMDRLSCLCQLVIAYREAGLDFPNSGDVMTPAGKVSWGGAEQDNLYVLLTFSRRKNDSLANKLRQTGLAMSLVSFVKHVSALDWETTEFMDFLVDPSAMTMESIKGLSDMPFACLNLRVLPRNATGDKSP